MHSFHSSHRATFFAPFVSLALGACAPSAGKGADEGASDDNVSPLLGAQVDPHDKFDVGVCSGPLTGGATADQGTCLQAGTRCSGTLVAPNLVLTARHCLRGIAYSGANFCDSTFTDDPITDAPVRITTSDSLLVGDPKWYEVEKVLLPEGRKLCNDDVALLLLAHAVPLAEAFPVAMSINRDVAKAPPKAVAIVGRGAIVDQNDPSTGTQALDRGDFRRRVLEHIPIVCASDTAEGCTVVDFTSPPTNVEQVPSGQFVIGPSIASGDSGAAVLDQKTFHFFPLVIGVTSAITRGSDGNPNTGEVTRLDTHKAFLLDGLLKAAIGLGFNPHAFAAQAK